MDSVARYEKFSRSSNKNGRNNHPFHQLDVQEIERHRGLEIGEDGTVKELK